MTESLPIVDRASKIRQNFEEQVALIKQTPESATLEDLRIKFLGKKGEITRLMESLRNAPKDERPTAGKAINDLRKYAEGEIATLKTVVERSAVDALLKKSPIDVSLPAANQSKQGSLHPVSLIRQKLIREFRRLGFTVKDGPEVDLDYYNFSALNFRDDHPARDMQDTFFVDGFKDTLLRTHTSNTQIHTMLGDRPPLRVVSLGRTYRCDSDLTHTPMFHQVEGFIVDRNISMGDIKGVMDHFLKAIFGSDLEIRLRPSFFPFVEPGGEVDLQCVACRGKGCRICSDTGWLEIGGLGMIHPNVFEAVDYDSETYTGFAFGFGIDRMAMLKYGLGDLRTLFEGDRRFQSQFHIHSL